MKDGIGNEILKDDLVHVTLDSESVLAKVLEVSEGGVLDPATRKLKAGSIRVYIDITLKCPYAELPVQFLPQVFKIYDPNKEQKNKDAADAVLKAATTPLPPSENPTPSKVSTMFLKRPSDIKDEKLNPTK